MSGRFRYSIAVICIVCVNVLHPFGSSAQTYSFRTYDEYTGLPGTWLTVIAQDRSGLLWMGVDTGLYRYDGFSFHHMPFPDTLPRGNVSALFCDRKGTMWVGMNDGSLFTWNMTGGLKRMMLEDSDRINRITGSPDGKVWIVTQTSGIIIAAPGGDEKITRMMLPDDMTLFDIAFAGNGTFLAATQNNLHLCAAEGDKAVSRLTFPELDYTWIQTVVRMDDDTWFAGTDNMGLWMISRSGDSINARSVGDTLFMNTNIPALNAGPERTLTIATKELGAVKVKFSADFSEMFITGRYDVTSGLPDNNVRTIFTDREENLWIGLYTSGLAAVTTNAFTFCRPESDKEITYIGRAGTQVVAGTRSGLLISIRLPETLQGIVILLQERAGQASPHGLPMTPEIYG